MLAGRLEQHIAQIGMEVVFVPVPTASDPCAGQAFTCEMRSCGPGLLGFQCGYELQGTGQERRLVMVMPRCTSKATLVRCH